MADCKGGLNLEQIDNTGARLSCYSCIVARTNKLLSAASRGFLFPLHAARILFCDNYGQNIFRRLVL